MLAKEYPEIESATAYSQVQPYTEKLCEIRKTDGTANYFKELFVFADHHFLDFFNIRLINGTPNEIDQTPDAILVTEKTANRLFGTTDVIGKTFTDINDFDDTQKVFTIRGVIENFPKQSDLERYSGIELNTTNEAICSPDSYTYYDGFNSFVKIKPGINIDKLNEKLKKNTLKYPKNKNEINKYLYRHKYINEPIEENWVMFETFMGKSYADSPKYIYEYLAKNYPGKYKFIWVLNDPKEKLPYEGIIVKRFTKKYAYYLAKSKYFVFNIRQPLWFRKREGQVFLETWHGTPLKRLAFDQEEVTAASPTYKSQFYRQKQEWDYLIAANKFSSDIFKSCFMYTNGTMLEIGYPRNDLLYAPNKDQIALDLKKKLHIPLDKKTILYAPTWRDDEYYGKGQYKFKLKLDLEMMKEELGDEYVILLRTHHYIADALDVTGVEDFAYNLSKYDDITEIYLISDICITDYSSVFFDYANLKRPMLFYTYDIDKYRDVLRGFYIDMEKELPGPLVYSTKEVIDQIKHLDEMNQKYAQRYEVFYDKFCSIDDGNASQRAVEAVFK